MTVVDFHEFKKERQILDRTQEEVENGFEDFIDHIHSKLGVPNSFSKLLRISYYMVRYVDGSLNVLKVMILNEGIQKSHVEVLKKSLIEWLERIIESIKEI